MPALETLTAPQKLAIRTGFGLLEGQDVLAHDVHLPVSATLCPIYTVTLRDIPVRTSGADGVIATLQLPAWLDRWAIRVGAATVAPSVRIVADDAAGTLAAATVSLTDRVPPDTLMRNVTHGLALPTGVGQAVSTGGATGFYNHAETAQICVYQQGNSANAGRISITAILIPLLRPA